MGGRPPALVLLGDELVRTYAQLGDAVPSRRAGALRERLGVAPGDAVALFAANCPEYLEILASIWHAGGVAVPISSRLHAREAAELLDASRARACFVTADVAEPLARALDGAVPVLVAGAARTRRCWLRSRSDPFRATRATTRGSSSPPGRPGAPRARGSPTPTCSR